MKSYLFKDTKIIEFESTSDVFDFINKNKDKRRWETPRNILENSKFYGCNNIDEAINQLRFGDDSYTQYFINELNDVKKEEDSYSGIFLDREGFIYDMGSVVSGEPECCLNMNTPEPKKSIDLIVSISFSGWTETRVIKNRGIAIANLINTLITKGYLVNLKFVRFYNDEMIHIYNVDTKVFCVSTIAFFCTPQFFRGLNFLIDEIVKDSVGSGGECSSYANFKFLESIGDKSTFFIKGGYDDDKMNDLYSIEKANSYISKLFNDFIKKFEEK